MGYRVAVIGATGNVGREILTTLAERNFPADDVAAIASERSVGQMVSFGEDDELKVVNLSQYDFKGLGPRYPRFMDLVQQKQVRSLSTIHHNSEWIQTYRWLYRRSTAIR